MQLSQITDFAIQRLFGRLLRRAACIALLVLFTLIAVYHFTVAGTLELEGTYGMLYARLIVAAIYLAAALIMLAGLWATRARLLIKDQPADAIVSSREVQVAALIEAAMLGFAMARKFGGRVH
jgi:uncharacterized membrane protein